MEKRNAQLNRIAIVTVLGLLALLDVLGVIMRQSNLDGLLLIGVVLARFLTLGLALIVALVLVVGVHELGHHLAGLAVGFKFRAIKIGPFLLRRWGKRIRFSSSEGGWNTGYSHMSPLTERNLLNRVRWHILGGPIASLLLLALAFAFLPWREALFGPHPDGTLTTHTVLVIVIGYMVTVVAYCLSPWYGVNDARLFLRTFGAEADRTLLKLKLTVQEESGLRCEDWDLDLLRKLAQSPVRMEEMYYTHLLAMGLLYQGQVEEGLEAIDKSYDLLKRTAEVPEESWAGLAQSTAFARAYFGHDLEGARKAMEKGPRLAPDGDYGFFRASAAIAMLEGDLEALQTFTSEAKKWLDDNADPSSDDIAACYEEMDKLLSLGPASP